MKIAVPVGQFHVGNTSEYVVRACDRLGHQAAIVNPQEFALALKGQAFDYYFCVDSGEPIDFTSGPLSDCDLSRVAMWFIDYRHHSDGKTRTPGDEINAKALALRGGWIFQAQLEDVQATRAAGISHVSWLPLGADPDVWQERDVPLDCDLGFVGNVWDQARASALSTLLNAKDLRLAFPGHGKAWKEEGALLLSRCRAGFNISSYYGTPVAFDVNMRVFETLSCARPLITNFVPALAELSLDRASFVRTYNSATELLTVVRAALKDEEFLGSGGAARRYILENATYEKRLGNAFATAKWVEKPSGN